MSKSLLSHRRERESGIALLAVMLVLGLASAMLVGYIALIANDQEAGYGSRDQTLAYGGAHAGLEQLTSRLGELFATNFNPTSDQVNAIATNPPNLLDPMGRSYITYTATGNTPVAGDTSGYRVIFESVGGYPKAEIEPRTIGSGPFEGLKGRATQYTIEVTARTTSGSEVRMRRTMQTVLIPAFQFGIFSEPALAFHAGPAFNFGGRVHTNGDLYLGQGNGTVLTMGDRVTVLGEVIRTRMPNGFPLSVNHTGTIRIPDATHTLAANEGSLVDSLGSAQNEPKWTNAVARLERKIINGRTGAKRLDLPLAQMGAQPIDLIRRPAANSAEDVNNAPVYSQRYYSMAALRILLSDTAADIMNLPGVVTTTAPLDLTTLKQGSAPAWYPIPGNAPIASVPSDLGGTYSAADGYLMNPNEAIVRGFIKIERQSAANVWTDVTQEILSLGFTGRRLSSTNTFGAVGPSPCAEPYPNAIIRLQRVKDDHPSTVKVTELGGTGLSTVNVSCGTLASSYGAYSAGTPVPTAGSYWPNVLYDAREGAPRDSSNPGGTDTIYAGGAMSYIEIDVANLAKWFAGTIGVSGPGSEDSNGGYVLYISDRRTNHRTPATGLETGEYEHEDVVNLSSASGVPTNGILDDGEDSNLNGILDNDGAAPYAYNNFRSNPFPIANPQALVSPRLARSNAPLFFRRAVKLVNGASDNASTLRFLPAGMGLTVVAENPVYIQGNYNTGTAWTTDHRASSVIADAVTMLSNSWDDVRSFKYPHYVRDNNRRASATWYRVAIVGGKTRFFPKPSSWGGNDTGSDGGVHNFLRFLEDWDTIAANYRGSIISFYYSRQANGLFKSGGVENVYRPPTRNFSYDSEFLEFNMLPPKPPSFRDVNTLTFRQILRPTVE